MRRVGYQNAVLTGIAVLLAIAVLARGGATIMEPSSAQAQPDAGGLSNALEQRKQMISELRSLTSKLDRIEAKLSGGLSVKVTEMPPLKFPPEARTKSAHADDDDTTKATSVIRPVGVRPADAGADGK